MAMFKTACELCDVVSMVLYCKADCAMMLTQEGSTSEFWIPCVKIAAGDSWEQVILKKLKETLGLSAQICRLLRLHKLWIPNNRHSSVQHSVFEVEISSEMKLTTKSFVPTNKSRPRLRWVTEDELMRHQGSNYLRSPELMDYFSMVKSNTLAKISHPNEYSYKGNFMEVTEDVLVLTKESIFEQCVEAAGLERGAQEALYTEFLVLCFPATFMCYQTFSKFITEIGWSQGDRSQVDTMALFRAADMHSRSGLSFRDFLYFIAAVEPGTIHGNAAAEVRCRYIFRYFDVKNNNLWRSEEVRNFVVAVMKSKKQRMDSRSIHGEIQKSYADMRLPENHALTLVEFLSQVSGLKLRGTSHIFRSPVSIMKRIKDIIEKDSRVKAAQKARESGTQLTSSSMAGGGNGMNGAPAYMKKGEYELATHTVRIQKSGTSINIDQLANLGHAVTMSSTRQPILDAANRRLSLDQFNQKSTTNELLKALRYLHQVNLEKLIVYEPKVDNVIFTWGQLDNNVVARNLIEVCGYVKNIFVKEPRLLDLSSPIYVMGDLHGNFGDLLYFEKVFWHVGPGLCPCNMLFLGDYVDRGWQSVEVIAYLFCYKLQNPTKLRMVRGNHEIRKVQMMWTFEKECRRKFGEKLGAQVFEVINETFDVMPLAAVIDGRVFCCHGGIPPPWLCELATAINKIPVVLNDPQNQSALAWEVMWNDPVKPKFMTDKISMELMANEGFAYNARRATAHIFNVEALEKFLKANGFTHLIRAHEVVDAGFHVQQKGKLLTVFSSSKYCLGNNEAACVLADQGKLRILRLETD